MCTTYYTILGLVHLSMQFWNDFILLTHSLALSPLFKLELFASLHLFATYTRNEQHTMVRFTPDKSTSNTFQCFYGLSCTHSPDFSGKKTLFSIPYVCVYFVFFFSLYIFHHWSDERNNTYREREIRNRSLHCLFLHFSVVFAAYALLYYTLDWPISESFHVLVFCFFFFSPRILPTRQRGISVICKEKSTADALYRQMDCATSVAVSVYFDFFILSFYWNSYFSNLFAANFFNREGKKKELRLR